MQNSILQYVKKNQYGKKMKHRFWTFISCLSLIVILCVFWNLKLTGITLAGDAFCGNQEHVHNEECQVTEWICVLEENEEHEHTEECFEVRTDCGIEEHIHIESCYSDIQADLETEEVWKQSFSEIDKEVTTSQYLTMLAQSQIGNGESERNFEVGDDGVRRGITRYGQWYGNPYGDWSAMFVSFCLYYADVTEVPFNVGAESMRLQWEEQQLFKTAAEYAPKVGNLVFLHKEMVDEKAQNIANAVAIIKDVNETTMQVIAGDIDGVVAEVTYKVNSAEILGYGIVPEVSEYAVKVEQPEEEIEAEEILPEKEETPEETEATQEAETETEVVDTSDEMSVEEVPVMFMSTQKASGNIIAATTSYNNSLMTSSNRFVFYTVQNGTAYAFDGSGNAVPIFIGGDGKIYSDIENPDQLLWTSGRYNNNSYAIQNVATGRYLHPFFNSNSDNGMTTPGRWGTSVTNAGNGVKFSHSAYIGFDTQTEQFFMTRESSRNVTFELGMITPCTVWFDGTNGGLMSLGGSDNTSYTSYTNSTMILPTSWKSPDKYAYVLKGWYDITNHKYYAPGDKVLVTGNMVFYADWQAASYDVGIYNEQVDNETLSTNSFLRTRMFDYGALLNVLSERVNITANNSSHSETWQLLTSGNNSYNGKGTMNFILRDWDRGNEDISYPQNHNDINNPTDAGTVYPGLYTDTIREVFFDPEVELPGKTYLGEADYLFQLCDDPTHDHYGYYYYDSEKNAASYNQTNQRFYVYEYLECTRDSLNNGNEGKYSDFLPFNSPYANTNGKNATNYTYAGVDGEYTNTTHYMYDSRYNDSNNTTNNIGSNFWFGMSIDISFYLPNAPGTLVVNNEYGNKDIYGKDMHFRFTGDDDVWIFVDDTMVLDLGGLHGRETGDINFSTGEVTINGVRNAALSNALKSVQEGEHTLTLYYLERGSSMSNCAIYFNLAPRFQFSIQKEDAVTKEVLNGAQFSVFTDKECTVPATLWTSKKAHDNGEPTTNTFAVVDGVADMWGMGAGNVYYIKETKPPDDPDYGLQNGLIRLTFDKTGTASYNVEVLDEGSGVTPGFIVHGFRIDAETQRAYIIVTNTPKWAQETTTVQALKHWNDALDHSKDAVTVYLTVTNEKGEVLRLQEAVLNKDNNWQYEWKNLPKYEKDGVTPVKYGVAESYVSGYYSTVTGMTGAFEINGSQWTDTNTFVDGQVYILKNQAGQALSTRMAAEDTGFMWVSAETAKESNLAQWRASVVNDSVRFTNLAGQTLTFYYGNGNPTDFYAWNQQYEDNDRKQYFAFFNKDNGLGLQFWGNFLSSTLNSSQKFEKTNDYSKVLVVIPSVKTGTNVKVPIHNQGFLIENTPLEKETSVTVTKHWVIPPDMDVGIYEEKQITVRLLANGVDTGRTIILSLKNGWKDVFKGLPYEDEKGQKIQYSVKEILTDDKWVDGYGNVVTLNGSPPQYSVEVTNTYRAGELLPSTGSAARIVYILCGSGIMMGSLIYGIWFRRRQERRRK